LQRGAVAGALAATCQLSSGPWSWQLVFFLRGTWQLVKVSGPRITESKRGDGVGLFFAWAEATVCAVGLTVLRVEFSLIQSVLMHNRSIFS